MELRYLVRFGFGPGVYCFLGAEYPNPKKVNLSIRVGLCKPKKATFSATKASV